MEPEEEYVDMPPTFPDCPEMDEATFEIEYKNWISWVLRPLGWISYASEPITGELKEAGGE